MFPVRIVPGPIVLAHLRLGSLTHERIRAIGYSVIKVPVGEKSSSHLLGQLSLFRRPFNGIFPNKKRLAVE
ncbi:hypothetical protein E4K67_02175 [Desulfosporosinus fructosivorans]|uniref:Uncharacterized protein n=1 Tax=Desulfosporosinus fructosivorans TaxID=2018669 RepID=A0A4Z0RAK7_9FIRM|nr:hypothetical protein E4K67_02175 [Desulfosporosinus fructosivorans]